MRPLTQHEINDLEARGIKPGVIVSCLFNPNEQFTVLKWEKYEVWETNVIASISEPSIMTGQIMYQDIDFLYDPDTNKYATPIE